MIIYAEQVRHFYDGRSSNFEIAIFCNGTYTFKATDATTGQPLETIRALDVAFVHEMVGFMKTGKLSDTPPFYPVIEIEKKTQTETA